MTTFLETAVPTSRIVPSRPIFTSMLMSPVAGKLWTTGQAGGVLACASGCKALSGTERNRKRDGKHVSLEIAKSESSSFNGSSKVTLALTSERPPGQTVRERATSFPLNDL